MLLRSCFDISKYKTGPEGQSCCLKHYKQMRGLFLPLFIHQKALSLYLESLFIAYICL